MSNFIILVVILTKKHELVEIYTIVYFIMAVMEKWQTNKATTLIFTD